MFKKLNRNSRVTSQLALRLLRRCVALQVVHWVVRRRAHLLQQLLRGPVQIRGVIEFVGLEEVEEARESQEEDAKGVGAGQRRHIGHAAERDWKWVTREVQVRVRTSNYVLVQ